MFQFIKKIYLFSQIKSITAITCTRYKYKHTISKIIYVQIIKSWQNWVSNVHYTFRISVILKSRLFSNNWWGAIYKWCYVFRRNILKFVICPPFFWRSLSLSKLETKKLTEIPRYVSVHTLKKSLFNKLNLDAVTNIKTKNLFVSNQ